MSTFHKNKINTFLHQQLQDNLLKKSFIKNNKILVCLSGGQDSICLLKLLIDLQSIYRLMIGIIIIDHQWRYDSCNNINHLINILRQYHITTYIYQIHPHKYSEVEARTLRYKTIISTAIKYKYKIIITAHSASDTIETFFYKIMRGITLDSLNSLDFKRYIHKKIYLIRPLLNTQRSEITWFCRYYTLPIWADYSNLNYINKRNRIRYELIPYLQTFFQGNIEKNLFFFLTCANIDNEYIRQNTIKAYQISKHPNLLAINYQILSSQHKTIQIRVIQLFMNHNLNIFISYNKITNWLNNLKQNMVSPRNNSIEYLHVYKRWIYLKIV